MNLTPGEVITRRHAALIPQLRRRRLDPSEPPSDPIPAPLPIPILASSNSHSEFQELEAEISFHQAEFRPVPKPRRDRREEWRPTMPLGSTNRPLGAFRNFNKKRHAPPQQPIAPEVMTRLKSEVDILVEELRAEEVARATNPLDGPHEAYIKKLSLPGTLKMFSEKDNGYIIVNEKRTEKEIELINESNYNILKFVFYKTDELLPIWNEMETEILDNIDSFILQHRATSFRSGAFSVAIDFEKFPPGLVWRDEDRETRLLRPVIVDGVAVLYACSKTSFRPFYLMPPGIKTEELPYSHHLNLPVKPLFDIIIGFLIRGHKTTVYLPRYYQKYHTFGGLCKVDDVVAFKKLIELKFIEFREISSQHHQRKWFNVMKQIVDEKEGVFVSSEDYSKRSIVCEFKKPSERILTPCFLNTDDRLMVLEPTIRYRDSNHKFQTIKAEEILYFTTEPTAASEPKRLEAQLYLQEQIKLICELCQLYPIRSWHKVGIEQLLTLVMRAQSEFEMPGMSETDFERLRQTVNTQN